MPELPPPEIDRSSPIPFYFQLAELLEHAITQNHWVSSERLPSESELCEHFGLSRTTVRQALARLEQEGLISRQKGRGSFVADSHRRSWLLQSAEGFFQDETIRLGRSVSSTILKLGLGALPAWALDSLGLPARSVGVTLERLRAVDGHVAMYVVNHLPEEFAEAVMSMTDPNESLYARLKVMTGVEVAGAHRTLEAIRAGERLGALLELEPSAPAVSIHSVSWDKDERPFDCYGAWIRTDRLTIDIDVGVLEGTVPLSLREVPENRARLRPVAPEPRGEQSDAAAAADGLG